MADIHQFNHRAMATHFEVRIANEERSYAAQAAQATIDLLDKSGIAFKPLSRQQRHSADRSARAGRKNAPVRASLCLPSDRKDKWNWRRAALSPLSATALQTQASLPQWSLLPEELSILCESGRLHFDLGAIGKGFALDRMAELLRSWDCPSFLLVAGGSSILAGDPPKQTAGWSCGLGDDGAPSDSS